MRYQMSLAKMPFCHWARVKLPILFSIERHQQGNLWKDHRFWTHMISTQADKWSGLDNSTPCQFVPMPICNNVDKLTSTWFWISISQSMLLNGECYHAQGVDFSYHVWTNVCVRRFIIQCNSIHTIHEGEVLFYSRVYIQTSYYFLK